MSSASSHSPDNLFDTIPQLDKAWLYIVEADEDVEILRELGLEAMKLPWFHEDAEIFPAFAHLRDQHKSIALVAGNRFTFSEHSELICYALFATGKDFRLVNLMKAANGHVKSIQDWDRWTSQSTQEAKIGELASFARMSKPWISSTDWEKPIPIRSRSVSLPEFPVECLPEWLGNAVQTVSDAIQLPTGVGGTVGLGVLALACQGKWVVSPREDWKEQVSLYLVASSFSGTGKSIVYDRLLEPISTYEAMLDEKSQVEDCEARALRDILKGKLEISMSKALEGDVSAEEEVVLLTKKLAKIEEPKSCELYTSNATPESVTQQLALHDGMYAVFTPEGGEFFSILSGRYSRNGKCNFDIFLKADSGESIRVHRVGQNGKAYVLDKAHLTNTLCVQPIVLEEVFQQREFRERGLLGRFLMCNLPSPLGTRNMNPPLMDKDVLNHYADQTLDLLSYCGSLDKRRSDMVLAFDEEAFGLFTSFRQNIENELGTFGRYSSISPLASKFPGRVARIAGLIHIAEMFQEQCPAEVPISKNTLQRAITIGEYFLAHALALDGGIKRTPEDELANRAIGVIRKNGLCRIKAKDIYYPLHKTKNEIDPVLERLERKGLIRKEKPKPGKRTGRPEGDIWRVNPYLHTNSVTSVSKVTGGIHAKSS